MSRKTLSLSIAISIITTIFFCSLAFSNPAELANIPNANFGCLTCHTDVFGGGLNPFGGAWKAIAIPAGHIYTNELANIDSDGDGFTNQQEFGAGTNPGDPASVPPSFTITASAGPNGSITPSGSVIVPAGGSREFTIAPFAFYRVADVLVDGVSVGALTNYTFTNVTANHTISASFARITYTIVASSGPNGTISPIGTVIVNAGANQIFILTPDPGYVPNELIIDGISSDSATGQYSFNSVSANHTISASFRLSPILSIAATAGPNGSITPSGLVVVDRGASQAFTITANAGYHIADVMVDGASVGAVGTYTFTNVVANHTISASFAIDAPVTYTITASASANGSIAPTGAVTVNSGASQAFTITANAGYHIADVMVDGASVGAVGTYTFTNVVANHTISASFAIDTPVTYTITASASANGTIAPTGAVTVNSGASQAFTITANAGYHIADVMVDGASVGAVGTYTFTNVVANHTISASFAIDAPVTYTITASASANGSIAPTGAVTVNSGASQAFTITANAGYHIADVMVDGASVGAVGTYTFTNVVANHTISASFAIDAPITYTITASASANGSIAPTGAVTVNSGANQIFTIAANTGYHILDVLVDAVSAGAVGTYTFTNVIANHTIAASFAIDVPGNFTITASASANGSITPSGLISLVAGADQTFTITPNSGYKVTDVIVDGLSEGPLTTYTFVDVLANHTISASFEIIAPITFTITASASANGSITPSGAVTVNSGANQMFTIAANTGYHIVDVLVDAVSAGAVGTYTFTNVIANHTIAASFAIDVPVTFTITASASANGSIAPTGAVTVNSGANQAFAITANAGYHIADVMVDGASVGAVGTYTFTNVVANHTISASFAINTSTITASASANGSITPSGAVTVNSGANQIFTIAANTGYHILDVLVDGASAGAVGTYTFTNVIANHTISASFEIDAPITFTITASASANGSIIPSGALTVNSGEDLILVIAANVGYHIADVMVDGASVGVVNTYTFTNVTANHAISATFEADALPDISANITQGNFVDVRIGNASNPLLVNITNKGATNLNITDVVLSDSVNYFLDLSSNPNSNGTTKATIAPNAIWGFAVIFKPLSLGAKPAVVSIKSSDPDTPSLDIPLTANAVGLKGDVNDDGLIRSNDAILALRIAADILEPSAYQQWSADMNEDKIVRSNDAILILREAAGLGAPAKSITANRASIALSEVQGIAGDTITVPITVDNKNILAGGDLVIKYDNSVLLAGEIKSDDGVLLSSKVSNGVAKISFATIDGLKSNVIATIKFKVIADSVSALSFEKAELYGSDSLAVKSRVINGKFASLAIAPKEAALFQSFPNPCNPETWIPYQLKESSDVVIRIYSTSGKLMRQLNLGYLPAGLYTSADKAAHWDGRDMNGEWTSSGVYFYSIQAGKFSDVKKLIILR